MDLENARSIARHVEVALQVSRRTGLPPRPLSNAHAAVFAPIVTNGTVGQRTKLAIQLAKFGELADEAAQQVAPNNAGFRNLIGLAGHPSEGVAISRVNQVLTGQEVLKNEKDLIDEEDADRLFSDQAGEAFAFLGAVRTGVLENAKAILAAEAASRGAKNCFEARGRNAARWYAAFNSALGAYTRDGKQFGGLAKLNGGVTIVPEEMSVPDFEARISRAQGPQFRAAQNGVPVFASGRTPTAADIRKLQWVPACDGIYRISDGSGFLRLKDGGFYEVDIRKLPASRR